MSSFMTLRVKPLYGHFSLGRGNLIHSGRLTETSEASARAMIVLSSPALNASSSKLHRARRSRAHCTASFMASNRASGDNPAMGSFDVKGSKQIARFANASLGLDEVCILQFAVFQHGFAITSKCECSMRSTHDPCCLKVSLLTMVTVDKRRAGGAGTGMGYARRLSSGVCGLGSKKAWNGSRCRDWGSRWGCLGRRGRRGGRRGGRR